MSNYNPSSQKRSQNEYATTPYVQPTQYEKDKASAKLFGDISEKSFMIGVFTGYSGFRFASTISEAISYSIDPDKNLENDFNQIFGNALDLLQEVKRK